MLEAVDACRSMGSTGSRLLSGNAREWEELESEFARFRGNRSGAVLRVRLRRQCGPAQLDFETGRRGFLRCAESCQPDRRHPPFRRDKVIYPHRDLDFLEDCSPQHANGSGASVIVTESVFSMEGDIAPIEKLAALARTYGAEVVVDEAHATGVCGPQGRGIAAALRMRARSAGHRAHLRQSAGQRGAFVCGGVRLREFLINRARTFVFSTAMPPYFAGQIRAALDLARRSGLPSARHLQEIAGESARGLARLRFRLRTSVTTSFRFFLAATKWRCTSPTLQENGFAVKAIRPPTVPAGTARIRLSLTSRLRATTFIASSRPYARRAESLPHWRQPAPCMPKRIFHNRHRHGHGEDGGFRAALRGARCASTGSRFRPDPAKAPTATP